MTYNVFPNTCGGIQIDINAVENKGKEFSLCNHNCTSEVGGYDCPAAFTKNKGLKKNFASKDQIVDWLMIAADELRHSRDMFVQGPLLQQYYEDFHIPYYERDYIEAGLRSDIVEVNLFGGNPEMHPEITEIIKELSRTSFKVNLTTTGRRVMLEKRFLGDLIESNPDVIALSLDDIEPSRAAHYLSLGAEDLMKEWKKIPATHGQKQKAIESISTAKALSEINQPMILFNMVLHPGNINQAKFLIKEVWKQLPHVYVNPYPFQTSFEYKDPNVNSEYLNKLEDFVDWVISGTKRGKKFIERLHYWTLIKTILEQKDNNLRDRFISGEAWKCYTSKGYGYLQIGRSEKGKSKVPGGKLGCFWNTQTITDTEAVCKGTVANYIVGNGKNLSARLSKNPCPGCLMPRLLGDIVSLERGIDPLIKNEYLKNRQKILNF